MIQREKLVTLPPILKGWANRAISGKPSNQRQIKALLNYLPQAPPDLYNALGGLETASWARSVYEPYFDPGPAPEGFVDVLGLPYYGPLSGKDKDGNYFSPMTDFMDDLLEFPPAAYVHGMADEDKEPLGDTSLRWYNDAGGWFRISVDKNHPRYSQIMEAKALGTLRASSGVIPAFGKEASDGHIDTWLVGEISLVDTRDGFSPRNSYAIAKAIPEFDVLFRDYYGDPVLEKDPTVRQLWQSLLTRIRELFSAEVATGALEVPVEVKQDVIEEAVETALEEIIMEDEPTQEKCMACDAADDLKAELEEMIKPGKCERCPGLIAQIKGFVKAGKLAPREALKVIDQFTISDEGWEDFESKVNAKSTLATLTKAAPESDKLYIAGGNDVVTEKTVDEKFISKMVNSVQPYNPKGRE